MTIRCVNCFRAVTVPDTVDGKAAEPGQLRAMSDEERKAKGRSTGTMTVNFTCPHCSTRYQVVIAALGQGESRVEAGAATEADKEHERNWGGPKR